MNRLLTTVVAAGLAVGILAACGDDASSGASTTPSTTAIGPVAPVAENRAVTVSGTALPAMPDKGPDPAVGRSAPSLTGAGFTGAPVTVAPAVGKPRLVLFVAHWCPHCQAEVPRVVKWLADGTIPAALDVVAVSTGVQRSAPNYPPSAWLAKENWPKEVLADSAAMEGAKAFGLSSYPYFVLLKADNTVAARASGELDQAGVKALLATVGL